MFVGADVHVAKFTPLDVAVEQHQVAAWANPGEMAVLEFDQPPECQCTLRRG